MNRELPKAPNGEYQDELMAGKIYGFHTVARVVIPLEAIVHELPKDVIAIRGVDAHTYTQVAYVPTKAVDSRHTVGPTAGVSAVSGTAPDIAPDKDWGRTDELSLSQKASILEQAANRMGGWHMIRPEEPAAKPKARAKQGTSGASGASGDAGLDALLAKS